MLTTAGMRAPGILEHTPHRPFDGPHRRLSVRRLSRRRTSSVFSRDNEGGEIAEINGIPIDRLTYINTALGALPGVSLQEYFVPIMRLKKQLMLRDRCVRQRFPSRNTPEGAAAYEKMLLNSLTLLTRALNTASSELMVDGGTATLTLEARDVIDCLRNKMAPVTIEAGGVLAYPREPPEASFVYVVLTGTVLVSFFQPQSQPPQPLQQHHRRGGGSRKDRQMYFTSARDVVRLCGGGLAPEVALFADDASVGPESLGINSPNADGVSTSNATTAIQRSLRRASRSVGQPTLQSIRTEELRGPVVLGASEALGLAPSKYASYTAATTSVLMGPASSKGVAGEAATSYVEFVDAFRVRTRDVHSALVEIAAHQQAERQQRVPQRHLPWCTAANGDLSQRAVVHTVADFIVAARRRSLYNDYAATELLMRQSWLLQDAPSHTIRTLISHLVPRTYMPQELIACPHTPGSERQLCFLRRGRLRVFAAPKSIGTGGSDGNRDVHRHRGSPHSSRDGCDCWRVEEVYGILPAEVVESGASFGELSVLFREPRHCVLRAESVCDVWCLPHRSFTVLMQRDAALREGLLQKAAVLRIEWMGEQRFTRSLAQQLRASTELLSPLPDIAIRLIQERLEPMVYPPGSLVASTSTKCTEMIFIMRGTLSSICVGAATYGAGDVLGEGCLLAHRWPLGLVARTMVEGWRIKVDQLVDALRRIDQLHSFSGLVTSRTPQLMKRIFADPLPEMEVDAVGRQRMPTVKAPPAGVSSFLAYGRIVSEVQLKALCFLYRDYVRWEDINYSTVDSSVVKKTACATTSLLDVIARDVVANRLRGGKTQSVSTVLNQHRHHLPESATKDGAGVEKEGHAAIPLSHGGGSGGAERVSFSNSTGAASGSGCNAVRVKDEKRSASARSRRAVTNRAPRRRTAAAGAFLVAHHLLGHEQLTEAVPVGRSAVTALTTASSTVTSHDGNRSPLAPRLNGMTRLLEERNRTWAAEQRHEAALAQQEANQRDAAGRDPAGLRYNAAPHTLLVKREGNSSGAVAVAPNMGIASLRTTAVSGSPNDVSLAPVHIFLLADKPKYELTLQEGIAIGYVMQLPDIANIKHSVSLVDPDVALGPPTQRARRHLMSITPNDRYNKHNFLFAAASLEEDGVKEYQQLAAEAQAEATARDKTRKLFTMMRTAVAARMDEAAAASPHMTLPGDPNDISALETSTPDRVNATDELAYPSPGSDSLDPGSMSPGSPLASAARRLHMQGSALLQSPGGYESNDSLNASPSPFRGSASRSIQDKKADAFMRLMHREPITAVDMLRRAYNVHPSITWAGSASSHGSPPRQGRESRSANGSGLISAQVSISGDSLRRAVHSHQPALFERIEAVMEACELEGASKVAAGDVTCAMPVEGLELDTVATGNSLAADVESINSILLTNRQTPICPTLVEATSRDRWHSANYLSASSAPPAATDGSPLPSPRMSIPAMDAKTSTAAGVDLPDYFYGSASLRGTAPLFVEGYGPLQPLEDSWMEYPPTIQRATVEAGRGGTTEHTKCNGSAGRAASGGVSCSRLTTSMAAAAASIRRSASRPGGLDGSFRVGDGSFQGLHGESRASVVRSSTAASLGPHKEVFAMPQPEDTEALIRRIQRDVHGLNAVAKEQRRERDGARARQGCAAGRHHAAVEATLKEPTEGELELLEVWRMQYRRINSEEYRHAPLPFALRKEAGPDHVKNELRFLADTPAPMDDPVWRSTAGVQAWQEQQQQVRRAEGGPLFHTATAGITSPCDAARRVVATIGAKSLGFTPKPLQSSSVRMNNLEYESWVRQREDFFAAYKELLDGRGGRLSASVDALTPPVLHFCNGPSSISTSRGTPASFPLPSSTYNVNVLDSRTAVHPLSADDKD